MQPSRQENIPGSSSNSPHPMIGPTPTFYDPESSSVQQLGEERYRQWIDSYPTGGMQNAQFSFVSRLPQHEQYYPNYQQQQQQQQQQHPGYGNVYGDTDSYQQPQQSQLQQQYSLPATPPILQQAKKSQSKVSRASPPSSKRKRSRKSPMIDDSESEDDDDFGLNAGISVGMGGLGVDSTTIGKGGKVSRLPGACTHCKKLKMKCDFPENDNTCKRCKSGGHVCIVEGRKPRTAPNKREYLLAQIRQKDAIIDSLLKQLHNPYLATPLSIASYRMATSPGDENNRNVLTWLERLQASYPPPDRSNTIAASPDVEDVDDTHDESEDDEKDVDENSHIPLGLLANLSLSGSKKNMSAAAAAAADESQDGDDDNVGVANETYFMPGPATDLRIRAALIEQHSPPEILVHGLVTPDDVERLFEIYFEKIDPFISVLDPVLHTPASTFARCPFLFTVVCAIASRYYTAKSEIYPIAMHFAKHSAANALIDGWKSVELCQAYILMSIYAVPARRWEEDRSWLYTGLAIRIATDLNLHQILAQKPADEKQERENLNRTRVWMICFNLDRSTATQFGKPITIKEDHVVRHSQDWYKKSPYNMPYDVHLCGYTALLRIVAKFHEEVFSDPTTPTGLNQRVDFRQITLAHDAKLTEYHEEWTRRFADATTANPNDRGGQLRQCLLPFLVSYSRLVMFSFGFQQAYQRGIESDDSLFFNKCLESAKIVIRCMIDQLAPSGYMRYAPDGHFVFSSFASAWLLKLLRPQFANLLSKAEETEIFDLIGKLIQILSSPAIAIDDRHTPKLYARFLAGLLSRHRRDGASVGRLQTQPPAPPPPQSIEYGSHQGQGGFGQDMQYNNGAGYDNSNKMVYRQEATYSAGTGPIQFGGEMELLSFDGGSNFISTSPSMEEETLATMQALKNPAWWNTMMMPGFSWPGSSSPSSAGSSPTYQSGLAMGLNPLHPYGLFQGSQQMPMSVPLQH